MTTKHNTDMRPWSVDLASLSVETGSLSSKSRSGYQVEPCGYVESKYLEGEDRTPRQKAQSTAELKLKKAWEAAKSPSSSIFMTLFMAWMSGNSVNIFSIMITMFAFINPLKAIFGVNAVFTNYADIPRDQLILCKITFIGINMITLGIAIYKCAGLGLLPTSAADWASFIAVKQPTEFAVGRSIL